MVNYKPADIYVFHLLPFSALVVHHPTIRAASRKRLPRVHWLTDLYRLYFCSPGLVLLQL
jgi:hypothetical protein